MSDPGTIVDRTLTHFLATGAWPTVRTLQLQYGPRINVRAVGAEFGRHLIVCEEGKDPVCRLTLDCLYALPDAAPILATFARALRFVAQCALNSADVAVDKAAFQEALDLTEKELCYIAMMVRYDGGPWSLSSYSNDGTTFSVTPNEDALFYADVETYADVLAVRSRLHADRVRISELLSRDWQPQHRLRPRPSPNTGWRTVDRQLGEMRERLISATTEEQFQAVGLLCREVLVSLAEAVHRVEDHPVHDVAKVSPTDAKRRLQAYFQAELAGAADEETRAHARSAVALADALQHKRTADYRTAAMCAEATTSVVSLAKIVSSALP